MVLSLRAVHPLIGKRRTITYKLDDGQEITSRELSKILGVSESASRNRLNRSSDPKRVFKPYSKSNGGKDRGSQKDRIKQQKDKERELMNLALKHI
jgi:hypothetical protein